MEASCSLREDDRDVLFAVMREYYDDEYMPGSKEQDEQPNALPAGRRVFEYWGQGEIDEDCVHLLWYGPPLVGHVGASPAEKVPGESEKQVMARIMAKLRPCQKYIHSKISRWLQTHKPIVSRGRSVISMEF